MVLTALFIVGNQGPVMTSTWKTAKLADQLTHPKNNQPTDLAN
jgi:hypothetical protein